MNLTKRQKEILDFIRDYRKAHGISPTQREIRETFQLSADDALKYYCLMALNLNEFVYMD